MGSSSGWPGPMKGWMKKKVGRPYWTPWNWRGQGGNGSGRLWGWDGGVGLAHMASVVGKDSSGMM